MALGLGAVFEWRIPKKQRFIRKTIPDPSLLPLAVDALGSSKLTGTSQRSNHRFCC